MLSQWKSFAIWTTAILLVVLATIFYQPAAAKTGSLLIWMNNWVYVMDIDTLTLERVGPAAIDDPITPSPGCFGQTEQPCWVVIADKLYRVDFAVGTSTVTELALPVEEGFVINGGGRVSWSPDGVHLAYTVTNIADKETELYVINADSNQVKLKAPKVAPSVAVAWNNACAGGLDAAGCELGYYYVSAPLNRFDSLPALVTFNPVTGESRRWHIDREPIHELAWSPDNMLLFSRPARHFFRADDKSPAFTMPEAAQLGNLSPDGVYTVYYQPFSLAECDGSRDDCMHLGVWLNSGDQDQEKGNLIYNLELSKQKGGLNFVPVWSPSGDSFVFFQDGNLVHYNIEKQEATIWYKNLFGKLRSKPVFSPDEEAIAFVDNQGQGQSEYRLVVVNPRLQPVEHIIETDTGFKVLAWLPD